MITQKYLDDLTYKIIGAAIEVHKVIGPGLLESVYHKCVMREFLMRGIAFVTETRVPIEYKGIVLESGLRCDFFVKDSIVVELKAVEEFAPVHTSQMLTYMRLLSGPKGILINFYCSNLFKEGQRTYVNELFRSLPDQ